MLCSIDDSYHGPYGQSGQESVMARGSRCGKWFEDKFWWQVDHIDVGHEAPGGFSSTVGAGEQGQLAEEFCHGFFDISRHGYGTRDEDGRLAQRMVHGDNGRGMWYSPSDMADGIGLFDNRRALQGNSDRQSHRSGV